MPGEPLQAPALEDFRVGDWLVQPSLNRLSRGGTFTHLRPQLTDLLLLLARHAGQAVSKELILKTVWGRQYVGESGLTRCIAELRQALDDDARQPKLLETIPKRGYRLVAPVVFLPREATPGNGANGNGRDGHGVPVSSAQRGGESTSVLFPAAGDGAVVDHAGDDAPRPSVATSRARRFPFRVRWTVVTAIVAAVVVVTLAAGDWGGRALLSERDTVLLSDVSNQTGDRVFDDALRLALAVNLEQAPFLRILPREAVRASLVRMGRLPDERVAGSLALDVCKREGAAVMLAASIARLGSRYVVGIETFACRTGDSIGRALENADDKDQVLSALGRAATRIRHKLGESRASLRQHDMPLVQATTPSLDALEAVTLGDYNRDRARLDEALAFYRRATELDPGFALAWARRGAAAWNIGLREDAIPAFRRAYVLRDRVTPQEAFYIEGHYYNLVAGDPARAIETYQAWKRMYPGSVVPPANLAFTFLGSLGQYDEALPEALEAVRLAPYSSVSHSNLVMAYLGLNRVADAERVIAEAASRGVNDRLMHMHLLTVALIKEDRAAMEREIRWASADPMASLLTLRLRASAAMVGGRLRDARRLWSEALKKAEEIGPARRVAEIRRGQAEAEALVGDPRLARVAVDAGLAADQGATTLVSSAIALTLAGEPARARSMLDSIDRQPVPDLTSPQVWLPTARALVAASLGRADQAVAILQPVARFERGNEFGFVPLGVRAIVQRSTRRPADSAAAFQEVIRLRTVEPASPWIAFARLGLARALQQSGDTAGSLAAYDAFLASWRDADPDASLLRAARQERAALARR